MNPYDTMVTVHGTPYSPQSVEHRIKYAYKRKKLRVYLNHDPQPPYITRVRCASMRWISSSVGDERFIMKRFPTLAIKIKDYERTKARDVRPKPGDLNYHGPYSGENEAFVAFVYF